MLRRKQIEQTGSGYSRQGSLSQGSLWRQGPGSPLRAGGQRQHRPHRGRPRTHSAWVGEVGNGMKWDLSSTYKIRMSPSPQRMSPLKFGTGLKVKQHYSKLLTLYETWEKTKEVKWLILDFAVSLWESLVWGCFIWAPYFFSFLQTLPVVMCFCNKKP